MARFNCYEGFKKYKVDAASVEDFLSRYYKSSRYTGRGPEYAECLLTSYKKQLQQDGFTFISHHDSVTGEVVAFYGW